MQNEYTGGQLHFTNHRRSRCTLVQCPVCWRRCRWNETQRSRWQLTCRQEQHCSCVQCSPLSARTAQIHRTTASVYTRQTIADDFSYHLSTWGSVRCPKNLHLLKCIRADWPLTMQVEQIKSMLCRPSTKKKNKLYTWYIIKKLCL